MLAAIILTLNEQKHLPACLASVQWADEVLVFDSFSTDRTVEIAQAAGAKVIQRQFDGWAKQREAALQSASAEWVLFVDADERVTPELAQAVRAVGSRPEAGWWIPRYNYIFGKLTRHTGWYPDYQLRLLQRAKAHYDPTRPVHELVLLDGEAGYLQEHFIHLNYETVPEFIVKQKYYASFAAQQLARAGLRAKPQNFVLQPARQFWWRFVTLQGWRDGLHGLRLSILMGWFEVEKYRMLREIQKEPPTSNLKSQNE
jgi:hypothetical protein